MNFTFDPILITNLILCIVIFIFGYMGYNNARERTPLYIAVAFALFGVSHLLTLLGLKPLLSTFLIAIRTVAYLLVVYAVWRMAFARS